MGLRINIDRLIRCLTRNVQLCIGISILTAFCLLSFNLFQIVRNHSVNIIFWDQFDFMIPFLSHEDVWSMFTWQHGPHRQGLGELVTWAVVNFSHWNTRAESYTILATLILTTILSIVLKAMLVKRLQWVDILIPLIFLNPNQWENLVLTPNISHSILPLFLIICLGFAWLIRNEYVRVGVIGILSFLVIFTGFGIFMGGMCILGFLLELIQVGRQKPGRIQISSILGIVLILAGYVMFFHDYIFQSAADCFAINWSLVVQYPLFMSAMVSKFIGISYISNATLAIGMGSILILAMMMIFFGSLRNCLSNHTGQVAVPSVIFLFVGYSLVFMVSTAIGRVCFGLPSGQNSRYMTLLIPAFYSIVIYLGQLNHNWKKLLFSIIFSISIIHSSIGLTADDYQAINYYTRQKLKWRECYSSTGDFSYCNEITGFSIYPIENEQVIAELNYLRENELNMFRK